ncbi:MAG: hypothetical protein AAB212_10515 [Bacteroidota bacterium]
MASAKAGPALNLELWFVLLSLAGGFIALSILSPPIAVALYTTSHFLIGQVSIFYQQVSVLSVCAAVIVVTLFFVRLRQGIIVKLFYLNQGQYFTLALFAAFFIIGFLKGHSPDCSDLHSLWSAFITSSLRGANSLIHYLFIGYWLIFIAMGMLACTNMTELKVFLIAYSILYISELLALPIKFYIQFFDDIIFKCKPNALSLGNVNRGVIGYMSAMAGVVALAAAHHMKSRLKFLLYVW